MNGRFWQAWRWKQRSGEIDEEIASHLRMAEQDRVERGAARDDAAAAARHELGNATLVREAARDQWGWRWLEDLLQDARFALRGLRKSPGFTLAIVLTLALGVGANVTMLGVVRMLLFRTPAQVREPENIMRVNAVDKKGDPQPATTNYAGYQQLAGHVRLLDLAAQGFAYATDFGTGRAAGEVERDYISHNYFDVLGTKLLLGRSFSVEEETRTGGASVAILGYDFWKRQFGADPKVLGREVQIGGRPHTIVGVAPPGFNGMDPDAIGVWLPLGDSGLLSSPGAWWLQMIGRPVGRATPQQAAAEATIAFRHSGGDATETIRVQPYSAMQTPTDSWDGVDPGEVALWLSGVALLVFLIACANVTNLFFVRIIQRRQETAVRLQLGATRWRLLRQFLAESLLASVLGGAAALLLAYWVRPFVEAFLLPPHFYLGDFLSAGTLATTGCFAVFAGIVSGLWPAWQASRPDLPLALKSGGRALHERSAIRSVMLVAQVALTLLLCVGAALFVRSLRSVHAIELGFDAQHVLVATASTSGYQPADIDAAYERMCERLQSVPGVERTATVAMVPFYGYGLSGYWIEPSGPSPARRVDVGFNSVSPDYFAAMGMKVLRGRAFLPSDRTGAPMVAIVNQSFAKDVAKEGSAIGRCLFEGRGTPCVRIVGVVPDERRYWLFNDMPGQPSGSVYRPLGQYDQKDYLTNAPAGGLVIRTAGRPSAMVHAVAAALSGVAPGGRYVNVRPIMDKINEQTISWRMGASMFTLFGVLALTLTAVGIYGVLAFLVRHRTSEIGLRLALGAMPGDILALVFRRGMLLVGVGIGAGVGAAIALARLMKSLLYGVAPTDAASFAVAAAVVLFVAVLACWIPARRAMRVDPMVALRHE